MSVKDYLLNFINKRDENSHFYELTQEDIENINKLVKDKYETWEWNFGNSPKYSLNNELKYPGGNVEFSLNVVDGLIKNIKHNKDSIKTALKDIDINNYFLNCNLDILIECIMGAK